MQLKSKFTMPMTGCVLCLHEPSFPGIAKPALLAMSQQLVTECAAVLTAQFSRLKVCLRPLMPQKYASDNCTLAFPQEGQAAHMQLAPANATTAQLQLNSPAVQKQNKKRNASALSSEEDHKKKRYRVVNLEAYKGTAAHTAGTSQDIGGNSLGRIGQPGGGSRMEDDVAVAPQHALDKAQEEAGGPDGTSGSAESEAIAALMEMRRSVSVKRRRGSDWMPIEAVRRWYEGMNKQA